VLAFVQATYLLGETFDTNSEHSWASESLMSTTLTSDEKAALLIAGSEFIHVHLVSEEAENG
jgi:hypothetical protein